MILQEIADEWQIPIWSAAIDFKKAFDSVSHEALWTALADQGIDDTYICLLSKLYADQTAAVKIDCTSKFFNIDRGVKQGDPLSSLLFNCVSESLMRKLKVQWRSKRYGLQLQPHPDDTLYNLRFADDILLLSTTLPSIKNMIEDLSNEARKLGLELHPDKTKILHNSHDPRRRTPASINIGQMTIEILPVNGHTKYLGRKLTFTGCPRDLSSPLKQSALLAGPVTAQTRSCSQCSPKQKPLPRRRRSDGSHVFGWRKHPQPRRDGRPREIGRYARRRVRRGLSGNTTR